MALGVQANSSTQCEWFCVTVEYRLYVSAIITQNLVSYIVMDKSGENEL